MLTRKSVYSGLLIIANVILFVMTVIPNGSVSADETHPIELEYVNNVNKSSITDFLYENQLIEEKVLRADKTSEDVINNYEGKEDAYALIISGEVIGYLSSKEEVKAVMKKIILQYMTEEELDKFEGFTQAREGRIINIQLSEPITYEYKPVHPDQLQSVEEVLTFIKKGKSTLIEYLVKDEECLQEIANTNNLAIEQLLQMNPDLSVEDTMGKGDIVVMPGIVPYINVMVEREFQQERDIPFNTGIKEDATLVKGITDVKQQGKSGIKAITSIVDEQNRKTISKEIITEKIIQEAVLERIVKGTKEIPSRGTGLFIWPADGGYISSKQGPRWGKVHKGIDIAQPATKAIFAADHGTVVEVGVSGGYGNKIVIDHNNGYQTIYAHLASFNVKVGDPVESGSEIGVMGSTGNSTGIHLHFEMLKDGRLTNPLHLIKQ